MSRRLLFSLLFLSISCLLLVQISSARDGISVDEKATKFSFDKPEPWVSLAVESGMNKAVDTFIRLELLDPTNRVRAIVESNEKIKPGSQKLLLDLPLRKTGISVANESELPWYRLHYRLVADGNATPVEGFLSLSEIGPRDFFPKTLIHTAALARWISEHTLHIPPASCRVVFQLSPNITGLGFLDTRQD